jgi:hypothetical protein
MTLPPKILLDCGAYSAWRFGESINLDDYTAFIRRNKHLLDCYVGLDTPPGSEGRREWRREYNERAAAQSYRNQQFMKDAGLSPIPVFHQDERFGWLERYVEDGEACIALAPFDGGLDALPWLDECFARLKDDRDPRDGITQAGFRNDSDF